MMNFPKAKKALQELRSDYIGTAQNDPKMWNLALGIEAAIHDIEARLSRIEDNQARLSRQIESLRAER